MGTTTTTTTTTTSTTTTTTSNSENEITSPNYPDNYPRNPMRVPMKMPMEVSDGNRIKIAFTDFELEDSGCRYDYVTIEDADGTMLLDKTCGTNRPREPIFSNTNKAYLIFHSDGADQFKGFKAEWEEVKTSANEITSPNYPQNYPSNPTGAPMKK